MRVLVIEDDPKSAQTVLQGLHEQGYCGEVCSSAVEGEALAVDQTFDLLVLELSLPDRDGCDLCRRLRASGFQAPILIVSRRANTEDKIDGLDAGADDYLTKPYDFQEFLARVRALLRRGRPGESTRLSYCDLELDLLRRVACRAGQRIRLSAKEYALLEFLMRHPDRVLDRTTIAQRVWGIPFAPASNVIDVYISNLRRKLDRGFESSLIHTIVGAGYRFGLPEEA